MASRRRAVRSSHRISRVGIWRRAAPKYALFFLAFASGLGIARLCWSHINLPLRNSWHVVGNLTLQGYDPTNNVLRGYFLILAPSVVLAALYVTCRGARRLMACPDEHEIATKRPHPRRIQRAIGMMLLFAVAILAGLNSPTDLAHGEFDSYHEGESLAAAMLCTRGQAPYRDFMVVHGFYQDPGRALAAFALFGRSIGAVRCLASIVKLFTFVLMAVVALLLCEFDLLVAFVLLGCYVLPQTLLLYIDGKAIGPVVFTTGRYVCVFVFLVSLLALHRAVASRTLSSSAALIGGFAVGFVPVASFAMSTDVGFYLTASVIVLLPLMYVGFPFVEGMRRRTVWSSIVGAAIGVVVAAWSAGFDLAAFVRLGLIVEPRAYALALGLKYPIDLLPWFGVLALAAANICWLTCKLLSRMQSPTTVRERLCAFVRGRFPELALGVMSLALMRSSFSRSDWVHVAIGLGPVLLLSLTIVCRHGLSVWLKTGAGRNLVMTVVIAGVACGVYYGTARISRLSLIQANFPLAVPDAAYMTDDERAAVAFLKARLAEQDSLYVLTSEGTWFYYLDKPPPTRFACVVYATTDFFQRELVDGLARAKVKLIIVSNRNWSNAIDGIPTRVRVPLVAEYVRAHYHPLCAVAGQVIWERNDPKEGR